MELEGARAHDGAHHEIEWFGPAWDDATHSWTFRVWAPKASAVTVEVRRRDDVGQVASSWPLERDGESWRTTVAARDLDGADLYGLRVSGDGAWFDPSKVLLDPWAPRVVHPARDPRAARDLAAVRGADTGGVAPLGVLCLPPPARPQAAFLAVGEIVIYETHVRGYTAGASELPSEWRGTFRGLIERLDHLSALGVTVLELLPVHAVDPGEGSFWGYMPLAWLAIEDRYAASGDGAAELAELCAAARERGIEVWLDVVYNHTSEAGLDGPTSHLRGIDEPAYYVVDAERRYANDAGTGNVVRAAHRAASNLILASLDRLADAGVSGFRFDLATILGRDIDGRVQPHSPLLDAIAVWAQSRRVRLVAEPWDMTSYQVGSLFPSPSWAQWNDQFRNTVRSFLRGDDGQVRDLMARVEGSPDLFGHSPRSINFVTAHDGFTLYDLVSYDYKHNEANGEGGGDGSNDNRSWNGGWEGEGAPADVRALRRRQIRNAFVLLLLSAGTPMFVAGDEFGRTQRGNNNAYNQDNELSWVDWERAADWGDLTRFVAGLIAVRRSCRMLGGGAAWTRGATFFGAGGPVDDSPHSHTLGWHLHPEHADGDAGVAELAVVINAWNQPVTFQLPAGGSWSRLVDTALDAPEDLVSLDEARPLASASYLLAARSAIVVHRSR